MKSRAIVSINEDGDPRLVWQTPSYDIYLWGIAGHEKIGYQPCLLFQHKDKFGNHFRLNTGSEAAAIKAFGISEELFYKLLAIKDRSAFSKPVDNR